MGESPDPRPQDRPRAEPELLSDAAFESNAAALAPGGESAGAGKRGALPRSLALQLTLAMVTTILIAVVPLALFAVWAMIEVDGNASERERMLIQRAIAEASERVTREQRSVTEWDDAVILTRAGDRPWIEENLGVWMYDFYGHDMAYVLDALDRPVYAMKDGETVPPAAFDRDAAAIAPMIGSLRAKLAAADGDVAGLVVTGILAIEGRPAVVSVTAISPSSDRLTPSPEQPYLHVAARYIDGGFLADLGARQLVSNVHFEPLGAPVDGREWLPLEGGGGALGRIVWDAERPGRQLVAQTAPGLVVSLVLMLAIAGSLLARLRRAVGRVHDSEVHAQHLASHDGLTGLPNRAFFDTRLDEALAALRTRGGRFAVHCIDLDRFKNVNDTLGHPAGDALIHQVAFRLSALVRAGDTVARLGGDEFAIIQTEIHDVADARRLAERVLAEIRQPFHLNEDTAFVDSSIGTVLAPDFATERSELMRKADIALYEAKGTGKGRQCVFEVAHDEVVRRKRAIERDLREDLGGGTGLSVVYQPVFAIDGVTLAGAEALVRWNHPTQGPISPTLFIPVAEERGLIQQLGAWVLREACIAATELGLPWVAVNVSAVQFRAPDFVDLVLDLLHELDFSPERLQLEITEGLLLDATETIASALTKLRFAGVCIALDDFGTGYSSLKYLHRYKVDKIKIDQSFVQSLGSGDRTDAIVRAMIDLARALDLGVTAEGVETEAQWRRLADFGTPELQGYLFSKPVRRAALRGLMEVDAGLRTHGPGRGGAR